MTCRRILDRFLELFPNYKDEIFSYKKNLTDLNSDSIVITLKDTRRIIFTATKNSDCLQIMHY